MRSLKLLLVSGIMLSLTLWFFACKPTADVGSTVVNVADPTAEAIQYTSKGWAAFEQKDYATAKSLFRQAISSNDLYADAYNGLGWTYARLDSMTNALQSFDIALGLQPQFVDVLAGRSFVSLALGKYHDAITAVGIVQSLEPGFYAFRHDPKVSLNLLLLVKAQSCFMLTDYDAAQSIINQLDPSNSLDPAKSSYIEDLALEIENLWQQS
ncbi:MAG: tetratricopeptide repeat protein [Bacteroidota bacterium]|jgi:tetratricopeptide (TPR) repeat protein